MSPKLMKALLSWQKYLSSSIGPDLGAVAMSLTMTLNVSDGGAPIVDFFVVSEGE